MFKGSSKEALVDDIQKSLKDNQSSYDKLAAKVSEADKIIIGLEEITKAMSLNHDYDMRKASIKKMLDSIEVLKG